MDRMTFTPATEQEWLAMRAKDVTSTEAAALFGEGAYEGSRTFFELYHIKAGILPAPVFKDNDRVKWGRRLEAAIAQGVAEDFGVIVEPFKTYMRIEGLRMGSSFDFKIVGLVMGFKGDETVRNMYREFGPGIMEVKNLDALQFKRNWIDDGETIEATPQIEFQVQHQLEVANLEWTLIAPLVGGNTPRPMVRRRDREVGALIRAKVAELWQRIKDGNAPDPDFGQDADTVKALLSKSNGEVIDMSDNPRLHAVCMQHMKALEDEKDAKKRKDAASAEILTIIGSAQKAYAAGGFTISAPAVADTYIEAHTRKGFRGVRLYHKA